MKVAKDAVIYEVRGGYARNWNVARPRAGCLGGASMPDTGLLVLDSSSHRGSALQHQETIVCGA